MNQLCLSEMQRRVLFAELRTECRDEYIAAHRHVWPELISRYKEIGYHKVSCHLLGNTLAVVVEAEDLDAVDRALQDDSIDRRWQEWMAMLRPVGNQFEEAQMVFEVTL